MVRLTGHMELPLARREAVLAALPDHVRLTRAEPGCLRFDVKEGDGRLDVFEDFLDDAAFAAHQARIRGTAWEVVTAGLARDYAVETV